MILHAICLIVALLSVFGKTAHADVSAADIANSLKKNLEHPYLFFTNEEKPAILERIHKDPEAEAIMDRLLAESNRYLSTPVPPVPEQPKEQGPQLFDRSGDFATIYYLYRNAAYTLAFVYQMTGDDQYARKSFEFAKELCDMPTWVMRLCQFAKAYKRVSPWNVPDDKVVFTFAIVTSDTASMMAAVYDWLYPALTREERDWIRGALLEKAIIQVRGNYEYHWWATAYRCNWCAWCNTGLGLAALTLLTEDPHLVDIVTESYNRISRTLDEIGVDGGWGEGVSYWGQTTRMSILFGDALKRLTNGTYNIYKHQNLVKNTVNFPLYTSIPPHHGSVNFADAGGGRTGAARLYNKLALETGSKEAAWIRENWFNEGDDIFDVIWPRHKVKPELPHTTSLHFRTIDWVIMRSDFTDPGKVMVACKAGKNDDPHHGHLDIGQFMVYWQGEGYISDLGHAAYDERYFDEEKYDTPHAASDGHNLIFVNGERQIPGKRFRQPLDDSIGGEIIEFRPGIERDYVLLDLTHAYPGKELKKWRRHILLEKPDITVVIDEVESVGKSTEIEARFHSGCSFEIKDNYTLLTGQKGMMALIPVVDGGFNIRTGQHSYLALHKQSEFELIPYFGTIVNALDTSTIISHIIVPVENAENADTIVNSVRVDSYSPGSYTLEFIKNRKRYVYTFEQKNIGLVLK